jgi:CRISPR-associated Cas5-like protein
MDLSLFYRPWPCRTPSGHTPLAFEVRADFGLFSRPDVSPSVAVSYPVTTWSAAKGIIETIFWKKDVWQINPLGVELLSPVAFTPYAFSYCGEMRKPSQIAKGANALFKWQVLAQPHFRLIFDVVAGPKARPEAGSVGRFLSEFDRRLRTGRHPTLQMGISDFLATASPCTEAPVQTGETHAIPLLLKTVHGPNGRPVYFADVRIEAGRLVYPLGRELTPC